MDTVKAMRRADAAIKRGDKMMIFDWHKAAQLIKERQPEAASAGLQCDWEWTGGDIYYNKTGPVYEYTYLSSIHAIPELRMDGETIECFIMEDNNPSNWNEATKWPQSALDILNNK